MKILFVLFMLIVFVGCSSADKKDVNKDASESTKKAMEEVKETNTSAVNDVPSCAVKVNRKIVNFGSPKVTSRAFRRLRLKSKSEFKITNVTEIDKPFGYYNSGDFPGDATYHDYDLCDMSLEAKDCSINLEFRPRAVESYESSLTVSYTDSGGEDCTIEVPIKGTATESYLGNDSTNN